jgi:hypothetical protein
VLLLILPMLLLLLLQEVGADGYNTALCLTGQQPVVGSLEETPQCNVA